MKKKYNIIRHYAECGRASRVIKRGLSLEQARKHCQDPKTRYESIKAFHTSWFDAYTTA